MNKIIFTLLAILLSSCSKPPYPEFPGSVKDYYVTNVPAEPVGPTMISAIENLSDIPLSESPVRCLHFELLSVNPYKIKYLSQVDLKECNLVGGFKVKDNVEFYNWVNDMYSWVEKNKGCFKL